MVPKLTEDEIDDLIYFARAGENVDLTETVASLAIREKVPPAELLIAAKDEGKSTCLHMASGNGHLETVRALLQYFEDRPKAEKQAFLDEPNEHSNTSLHWAALGGHLDVVKLLLDQGASPALANESNYVPLDLANLHDRADVAQYFWTFSERLERGNEESGLSEGVNGVELGADEDVNETKEGPS